MKQLLKYILNINIDSLKIAETKHSVITTLSSGLSVLIANFLGDNKLLGYISIVFCLLSVVISFFALSAKSIKKFKGNIPESKADLIYHKYIASLTIDEYTQSIIQNYGFPSEYQMDKFEFDLAKEILATAKRANRKYRLFNYSIALLGVGILLGILTMVL